VRIKAVALLAAEFIAAQRWATGVSPPWSMRCDGRPGHLADSETCREPGVRARREL
jgi:hypothetical protein